MVDVLAHHATNLTHRIYRLPELVLMPHSRCNCRCVMCDIWKANHQKKEISPEVLTRHLASFRELGVEHVTLSGGEALLHSNLWTLCKLLRDLGVKISLLSTGIGLKQHAKDVVTHCNDVIVSLDGSPGIHEAIRRVPDAFAKLQDGVQKLKEINPRFRITARCVIQKLNFQDFENVLQTASRLGVDQISFLPADVSSQAFNHPDGWNEPDRNGVALTVREAEILETTIRKAFRDFPDLFRKKFVAENLQKLLDIPRYYRALEGKSEFPARRCNAPWISAVIESNGDVLPCFFHKSYGNIHLGSLKEILNSRAAIEFRHNLDVQTNSICRTCVCTLYRSPLKSISKSLPSFLSS